MTRVLFVTLGYEPSRVGGAERQAQLQAEEMTARGHQIEVVCPRWDAATSQVISGVRVHRLTAWPKGLPWQLTYLPVLFVWLLTNLRRFDLVHVHLANLQADVVGIARLVVRGATWIKIATGGPRGDLARMRPVAPLTRYIGVRHASRLQAISEEIETDLLALGIPRDRILRIPNGLRTEIYRPPSDAERAHLREALGLPADVIVLWAGRFAGYKGVLDTLAAWRGCRAQTDATLLVVGEPAIDDPVTLPDSPKTVIRPWSRSIVDYYRAADIYVHSSHADGMPNVVLEAMACGLAVVATRVAAVPSMIEDGVSGRLVAIGDVDAIRAAIEELVADVSMREAFGRAAAMEIANKYSIERVVDQIERGYAAILGGAA